MEADSSSVVNVPLDPLLRSTARIPAAPTEPADVAALYREHRRRLLGLAAAITLDGAVAEEVVHEAFIGLQRHRSTVQNPVGYLQRSVVNLSVNLIRRRRVAARHPQVPPPPASSPEVDETWTAVVRLPPRQRAVVALRVWQDMTIDDIADTLDWPPGSVKSTLHRALKRLEEELR